MKAIIPILTLIMLGAQGIQPIPTFAQTPTLEEQVQTLKNSSQRWIEVNIATQRLTAWEGSIPIYSVIISTGKAYHETPRGSFAIESKHDVARMRGDGYDLPDVPYTMYYSGHYAIHGAYWHHQFGTPVSHGCVNVAVDHAQWLFNWTELGTPVIVK